MLALVLFNAGLGVRTERLRGLLRGPLILITGLAVNLLVPLLFILGLSQTLRVWHNPVEVQLILVGLALVASMPVAGSSTAWSQNADGDLALSLGLVVFSTCLSPLTTPSVLHAVGWVASGVYADCLHDLARGGTSLFLAAFVMLPSLLGICVRGLLGEERVLRLKPVLKLVNAVNLLALCYSNAAVALPQTVADPDWDFLAVMLAVVLALCVVGFASGWAVARACGADRSRGTSLMFGLGMNNNGTGLVLAATALANLPGVMLPVIFYNLVQHVVAAFAGRLQSEKPYHAPPPDILAAPLPLAKAT
jgi:BASS family bile acid:Na+ symporter